MKVQPTTKELIAMLYERLPELFDRAAQPAPVQEPDLAKSYREELDKLSQRNYELRMENAELKNTPPAAQRQYPQAERAAWVGLTDEEIYNAWPTTAGTNSVRAVARAIEAKLKEKNA